MPSNLDQLFDSSDDSLENDTDQTEEKCLNAVKSNPFQLKHVKVQTEAICMAAIAICGYAIMYVRCPTDEMWATAIINDTSMLKFVTRNVEEVYRSVVYKCPMILKNVPKEYQTEDLCWTAICRDTMFSLQYVKNPTVEMFMYCVNKNYDASFVDMLPYSSLCIVMKDITFYDGIDNYKMEMACIRAINEYETLLECLNNPTERICIAAVNQNSSLLKYIKTQTDEMCKIAVYYDPYALRHVENHTEKICMLAVQNEALTLEFVKNKSLLICFAAIKKDCRSIIYVPAEFHTEELCWYVIFENVRLLHYLKNPTERMCIYAAEHYDGTLMRVINQTEAICIAAVQKYPRSVRFVRNQKENICLAAVKAIPDGDVSCDILSRIRKPTLDMCFIVMTTLRDSNCGTHMKDKRLYNTADILYKSLKKKPTSFEEQFLYEKFKTMLKRQLRAQNDRTDDINEVMELYKMYDMGMANLNVEYNKKKKKIDTVYDMETVEKYLKRQPLNLTTICMSHIYQTKTQKEIADTKCIDVFTKDIIQRVAECMKIFR